jgi:hypothetical protein
MVPADGHDPAEPPHPHAGEAPGHQYSFLFMRASGAQLRELTTLIDDGHLRPVVDRVFPFDATLEAVAYVDQGRAKGKVVVTLDSRETSSSNVSEDTVPHPRRW